MATFGRLQAVFPRTWSWSSLWSSGLVVAIAVLVGLFASSANLLLPMAILACILWTGYAGASAVLGVAIVSSGLSLSVITGGELPLLGGVGGGSVDALRLVVVLGGFLTLVVRRPSVLAPLRTVGIYLAFIALGAASVLWSPTPIDGLRILLKLSYPIAVLLVAIETVKTQGDRAIINLISAAAILTTLLNLSVALSELNPFTGEDYSERFGGALHPNSVGLFCASAGLVLYTIWIRSRSLLHLALVVALAGQLVATGSRTALVAAAAGFMILDGLGGHLRRSVTIFVLVVTVWLLVPTFGERTSGLDVGPEAGAVYSGPSVNLSGRVGLWADAWAALMSDRQIFGRGLGAADLFVMNRYTAIRNVHSGYLLLLIDVGFLGLGLILAFFIVTTISILRTATQSSRLIYAQLYTALLVVFLLASFAESTFASFAFSTVALWVVHGLAITSPEATGQLAGKDIVDQEH